MLLYLKIEALLYVGSLAFYAKFSHMSPPKKKKKKKILELHNDLIPLKGYIGNLRFYAKFSHMSKEK